MVAYSDEVLMAHADGELDEPTAREVARELARNEVLRARYTQFARTSRDLGMLYAPIMNDAVPSRLLAAIYVDREPCTRGGAGGMPAWLGRFIPGNDNWFAAAVAAAALVAVVGGGAWLANRDGPSVYAEGAILAALETTESIAPGNEAAAQAVARMTFVAKDGAYCRQFSVLDAGNARDGVACRDARTGDWIIKAEVPANATAQGGTRPAEGRVSGVDQLVDALISGDVLTSEQEAQILARHWAR